MAKINQQDLYLIDKPQYTAANIPQQLISLWKHSSDPWGIKDHQSRYLYSNPAHLALLNLAPTFDLQGLLDSDIDHPIAEFSSHFQQHDRKVQELLQPISSLDIFPYGRDQIIQPYFCEKSPLHNDQGACVGTIFHTRPLPIASAIQYINRELAGLWTGDQPEKLFTEGELTVMFFALQSIKSKAIAKELALSRRTVENKKLSMYKKANVTVLRDFQAFCRAKGFDQYITPSSTILRSGVSAQLYSLILKPS